LIRSSAKQRLVSSVHLQYLQLTPSTVCPIRSSLYVSSYRAQDQLHSIRSVCSVSDW